MNLFTYGTLMFPEVWQRVTGLAQPGQPATLAHHAARRIRDQLYPALVGEEGAVTSGILYPEVSPEAMARLDTFEGTFYDRVPVEVTLTDGSVRPAWVYRAAAGTGPDILPQPWEAARFAREELGVFLQEDPGFRESGRD
jgi:gamma-glutamylcyclotransferase (GGCT)/AIG2-like uncharacterized protein YtfP